MAGERIAALLIGATIAITLFNPIAVAVNDNAGTVSVENESVNPVNDTYVQLDGYDLDDGETVYWFNESSGSYDVLTEGTDYDINQSDGSIAINSSGKASTGDDVQVSYDYQATSATTETVLTLAPLFVGLLVLGVFAARMQGMM